MRIGSLTAALAGSAALWAGAAFATGLEVTHWWTSGGEAAAVAEFAEAFDATGNEWVDAAIAGSGSTARPIMISRITGGDPMAATQFNHGRQAEELVEAGLMRDLTELAAAEGWADVVAAPALLESCTLDGRIYCVPVNIHSWQWMWLSNKAFEEAGVAVPASWEELVAAAPKLREAGKIPLAVGGEPWQQSGVFNVLMNALGGKELTLKVYDDKDAEVAAGPEVAKIFEALVQAREMSQGGNVKSWNEATNLVITDQAGAQIMGDWAQGEFQVAGEVAGVDYTCLPGLGDNAIISADGDAFYFPLLDDEEKAKAQETLASVMFNAETQVAFNLKKGSLPIRKDVDLDAANDCMKKGLAILAAGNTIKSTDSMITPDTTTQTNELFTQFFADPDMTAADAQARFAEIIASAD
ncbi:ABC transporter substrate-binding protein [Amaricoccus sp.]|uniref:ABC transporter substrate-binding protein n=1 Tax=Amaricoccus sp. TaxID=1872485 RepID=UPI001B76EDBF|nr:ABC transporter substrate-binding protein [Amaricoccus sp.]MBP7242998.1 carbohydrate ABC transporter substrate-binding protein [Amaricoccus sp.]